MKALIPDNINFPKGLSMKIFSHTIDEVLEHISIAKKVIDDA